jgi:dienelactone hydrolase
VLEHRSPPWHASNGSAFASRFLVVAPQLEKLRPWEASDAPMIDAIVRGAIAELRGDASRVALTGFSFGGEGAFQVASASRLPWSAIWAVDPALFRIPPLPAPDVRVWVHHGRAQPGSTNMPEFARALGLEPWRGAPDARRILTVLDADHAATCVEAYAAAHVYDWLA